MSNNNQLLSVYTTPELCLYKTEPKSEGGLIIAPELCLYKTERVGLLSRWA